MTENAHTPGPRAKVRIHLTNPDSGYESEIEGTVSVAEWVVIDRIMCGTGLVFTAAPALLEALQGLRMQALQSTDLLSTDYGQEALTAANAAIARATPPSRTQSGEDSA